MRQNRFTRSLTRLAFALVILLLGSVCAATAMPNHLLLQSEESFQAQLGDRAVQVAEGVYQVDLPSGEQIRVSFGREGMKHDIAWLRAEISTLQAQRERDSKDQSTTSRLRLLTRALARLEKKDAEESKRSITAYAAEDGPLCQGYVYHLDGGHSPWLVGGTTWGEARVEPDGFGPYPPAYYCEAYSFVGTTDEYNNFFWDDDPASGMGYAYAAASVNCGYSSWSCPTWQSYNWIYNSGCEDGFRSIYRTESNPD